MAEEIRLDPGTSRRIEGEIAAMAEALRDEQGKLDRRVGQLMGGGWTGVAADQYAGGWSEWCGGAEAVLQALAAMSRLIGETRVEISGTDEAVSGANGRLRSRLGPA